jgi:hypothetical protein
VIEDIVINLRGIANNQTDATLQKTCQDAAEMLEFFFDEMQQRSVKMDCQHRWFMRGGWPMNELVGPTPEAAVRNALKAVKEQRGQA